MSKKKAPTLPNTPTYYQDPLISQANSSMFDLGQGLTSGSIYQSNPGLGEAVSMNPDITRLTLEGLQAQLAPQLRTSRQDIINQLEANNQLTGSTTASALGNIQSDYESQLVSAGASAGIADINRALSNRVSLFGTGLNAIQGSGQGAQTASNAQNSFNLENYQNQLAKVLGEQKTQNGGFLGGLTGAVGGGLAGFAMGGPVGAGIGAVGGGLTGAFSPQGTGGALFQSGAGLAGSRLGNSTTNIYNPAQSNYSLSGAVAPESLYGGLLSKSYYPGM